MADVLLIDDDRDFTDAVVLALGRHGHTVRVLHDTDTAVEEMVKTPPDVVVLDVMFPEDSTAGFVLARSIRKQPALQGMPVLVLSAVNMKFPLWFGPSDIDETWMPVQDFLEKPIDFDVLVERVGRLVTSGERAER